MVQIFQRTSGHGGLKSGNGGKIPSGVLQGRKGRWEVRLSEETLQKNTQRLGGSMLGKKPKRGRVACTVEGVLKRGGMDQRADLKKGEGTLPLLHRGGGQKGLFEEIVRPGGNTKLLFWGGKGGV